MYGINDDLDKLIPKASGWATVNNGDDPSPVWNYHRTGANAEINNFLRGKVAVPVTSTDPYVASGLAEIETFLTAGRILRANISQFSSVDAAWATIKNFETVGKGMLKDMYFPASYTTPASGTSFTGNGTIAITVNDAYCFPAEWTVQCISTSGPLFEIACNNPRVTERWDYDLSTDTQFPSDSDIDNTRTPDLLKALTITITTGGTAFDVGDYWTFRTYANFRSNRKPGLGWIKIVRS